MAGNGHRQTLAISILTFSKPETEKDFENKKEQLNKETKKT